MMKYWREPLDIQSYSSPRGNIHVIVDRCKGCSFCVEFCPRKVLELSEEFNVRGYHPPFVKDVKACVYCGLCEDICPEFAIYVEREEDAVSEGSGTAPHISESGKSLR